MNSMNLNKACLHILDQLASFVEQIGAGDFDRPCETLSNATLGQHLRHTLEFFICFEQGFEQGTINYDKRSHDKLIETDKFIALSTKFIKRQAVKDDEIYLLFVGIMVVPEIVSVLSEAEKDFGREINYTVMTEEEFAFRKKNNDPFIWRFLKSPKILLVGNEEELLK